MKGALSVASVSWSKTPSDRRGRHGGFAVRDGESETAAGIARRRIVPDAQECRRGGQVREAHTFRPRGGSCDRQGEEGGRALFRRRPDPESAAVPVDDPVHAGTTDTGAGVRLPGAEPLDDDEDPDALSGLELDPAAVHPATPP